MIEFPCPNCIVRAMCRQMCEIFKPIEELFTCRYGDVLFNLLKKLGTLEILRANYENDYQGFVDVDALLEDGRVFSYMYYYGSCSGCDEWEHENLNDYEIIEVMKQEATYFDDINQYKKWLENKKITNEIDQET